MISRVVMISSPFCGSTSFSISTGIQAAFPILRISLLPPVPWRLLLKEFQPYIYFFDASVFSYPIVRRARFLKGKFPLELWYYDHSTFISTQFENREFAHLPEFRIGDITVNHQVTVTTSPSFPQKIFVFGRFFVSERVLQDNLQENPPDS